MLAHPRADALGDLLRDAAMHLAGIEHLKAHYVVVGGAQADLHRARRVNQASTRGVVEHGAVIDAFALLVRPGVAVRVKVDQRQRAVLFACALSSG